MATYLGNLPALVSKGSAPIIAIGIEGSANKVGGNYSLFNLYIHMLLWEDYPITPSFGMQLV